MNPKYVMYEIECLTPSIVWLVRRTLDVNAIAVGPRLEATKRHFAVDDFGNIKISIDQLNLRDI